MNQAASSTIFSEELLTLLRTSGSSVSQDDTNLENNYQNIPQLGLYYEMKEKMADCDFLQYNFIRIPPIPNTVQQTNPSRTKSISLVVNPNELVEITDQDVTQKPIPSIRQDLYANFTSSSTNKQSFTTPSFITCNEMATTPQQQQQR